MPAYSARHPLPSLQSAVDRLLSRPNRAVQLVPWIRAVLHHHTAYLMSAPGVQPVLTSLFQVGPGGREVRTLGCADCNSFTAAAGTEGRRSRVGDGREREWVSTRTRVGQARTGAPDVGRCVCKHACFLTDSGCVLVLPAAALHVSNSPVARRILLNAPLQLTDRSSHHLLPLPKPQAIDSRVKMQEPLLRLYGRLGLVLHHTRRGTHVDTARPEPEVRQSIQERQKCASGCC